jgi:predicted CXXCH cytochrome family protein
MSLSLGPWGVRPSVGLAACAAAAALWSRACRGGGGGGGGASPGQSAPAGASYVGSTACRGCHPDKWEGFSRSLHYLGYRDPGVGDPVLPGVIEETQGADDNWNYTLDGALSPTWRVAGVNVRITLSRVGSTFYVTLAETAADTDGMTAVTYPVHRVMGGGSGWKQRYQTRIGNSFYTLPLQWEERRPWAAFPGNLRWNAYNLQRWFYDGTAASYEPDIVGLNTGELIDPAAADAFTNFSVEKNCQACHSGSVGFTVTRNGSGEWVGDWIDLNAGCESCHGPGSGHIAGHGDIGKIVNPSRLPGERANEVCGQCHVRGTSIAGHFEFPWNDRDPWTNADFDANFRPGDRLFDAFVAAPGQWDDGVTPRQHHQQYHDYRNSGLHYENGINCWQCHDPHAPSYSATTVSVPPYQLRAGGDALCQSCHTEPKFNAERVTHVGAPHDPRINPDAPRCQDCHMPRTAASGYVVLPPDGVSTTSPEGYDISSHVMRFISPQVTIDHIAGPRGNPNACALCHTSVFWDGAVRDNTGASFTDWKQAGIDDKIAEWALSNIKPNGISIGQ